MEQGGFQARMAIVFCILGICGGAWIENIGYSFQMRIRMYISLYHQFFALIWFSLMASDEGQNSKNFLYFSESFYLQSLQKHDWFPSPLSLKIPISLFPGFTTFSRLSHASSPSATLPFSDFWWSLFILSFPSTLTLLISDLAFHITFLNRICNRQNNHGWEIAMQRHNTEEYIMRLRRGWLKACRVWTNEESYGYVWMTWDSF